MSWAGIAGNQFVSRTDAQGSGLRMIRALPTSNEWLDKTAALYYMDLDLSSLAGLTSTQFVDKDDLVSATPSWSNLDPRSVRAVVGGGTYYFTVIRNDAETNMYTVDEFDSGDWFTSSVGAGSYYDEDHTTCTITIVFDANGGAERFGTCYIYTDLGLWDIINTRQDGI